jgi:hypothetical protein
LIADEAQGKRILIDNLPTDGPFVVKLPTGQYQLTSVNLDDTLGIWQTSLPTTFHVRPRECTYLGTWKLQMQAGSLDGLIIRQVFNQPELAQEDLWKIIGHRSYPIKIAPLESPMQSSIVLTAQAQERPLASHP